MADEMGHQILDQTTDEPEIESNYILIRYAGNQVPSSLISLIKAPFLNSLRYGNDYFKVIDKEAYFPNYEKYIEIILSKPSTLVKLAVLKDETVLGWSIFENKTVHYVWVKKELRRQGIGKSLLPEEFDTITHLTRVGMSIWASRYPYVRFNPWA
jgi:GNAT superfamily N-acetyltransferase